MGITFRTNRADQHRQYDEDMVTEFLRVIDDVCLNRIQSGLAEATAILQTAAPKLRGVRILPDEATYAFFEALSCATNATRSYSRRSS